MYKIISFMFIFIFMSNATASCENLVGQYNCKSSNEIIKITSNGQHLVVSGVKRAYQDMTLNGKTDVIVEALGAVRLYSTGHCTQSGEIILEINGAQDFHSLLGQIGGVVRLSSDKNNLSMMSQFRSVYADYKDHDFFDMSDFLDKRGRWKDLANASGLRIQPNISSICEKVTAL